MQRRELPPRVADGDAAPRRAHAGERADADVEPDAHVAGQARQVGAGEPARRRPPPPPPNVPPLVQDGKELTGTLRQRLEQHRADPTCASCHAPMDPIGFGLENFDAIGRWRDKDGEAADRRHRREFVNGAEVQRRRRADGAAGRRRGGTISSVPSTENAADVRPRPRRRAVSISRRWTQIVDELQQERWQVLVAGRRRGEERAVPDAAGQRRRGRQRAADQPVAGR